MRGETFGENVYLTRYVTRQLFRFGCIHHHASSLENYSFGYGQLLRTYIPEQGARRLNL